MAYVSRRNAIYHNQHEQTMRTIKFRGKERDSGEWVYGSLCKVTNQDAMISTFETNESGYISDIDYDTIGQFTGLFDRYGKEIFEGDIIMFDFETRIEIEYVGFKNGRFVTIDPQRPYRDEAVCVFVKYASVIGNIHENPGLLKGGVQ